MIERLRNVYNAMLGRKITCGGNCSCHSVGSDMGDVLSSIAEGMGDSIDLTGMDPDIADMLRNLASPEAHDQLLAEMKEHDTPSESSEVCVHFDSVPVCHLGENDAKPEWCSASKCPVRAYQVVFDEMKKKAAMIAYG